MQYSVYRNSDEVSLAKYLMVISNDELVKFGLATVVPIFLRGNLSIIGAGTIFCPVVSIQGEDCFVNLLMPGTVMADELRSLVTTLPHLHETIIKAIDYLVSGY